MYKNSTFVVENYKTVFNKKFKYILVKSQLSQALWPPLFIKSVFTYIYYFEMDLS